VPRFLVRLTTLAHLKAARGGSGRCRSLPKEAWADGRGGVGGNGAGGGADGADVADGADGAAGEDEVLAPGARIVALPAAVAQKVRGAHVAPNLGAHMFQLMYNALDARATSISVQICLATYTLSVRDDGHGMTFDDLRRCGERSFTSKMRDLSQLRDTSFPFYGYRGESLAAISAFCHLEILSRSRVRPAETCRKVLKSGESATLMRVLDSTSIGTTVTCRDLFYNRPVARKMMAAQSSIGAPEASENSRLQVLLLLVRALAAIHPDVSFTVYEGARIQPVLSLPKCTGVRQAFARISKAISPHSLFHVGLSYGSYRIKALLCPPSFPTLPRTKDAQLVYVNGRLCARGLVHKRMNRAYKEVWEHNPACDGARGGAGSSTVGGNTSVGVLGGLEQVHFPQRKRRRSGLDEGASILAPLRRCPVFLLRIRCE